MKITIFTDNKKSWFIPFGETLKDNLQRMGHTVSYVYSKNDIEKGDICFLLSCTRIIEKDFINRNGNNIVIHASDLPNGKGFSPLQWQILEGKNEIILTLFEVVTEVDAGPYYIKDKISYNGTELIDELRSIMGNKIIEMSISYVKNKFILLPQDQIGDDSFYRKRSVKDDEIDPDLSIKQLFNHFRIADNENFPLWFNLYDKEYIIHIYKKQ